MALAIYIYKNKLSLLIGAHSLAHLPILA